MAPVPVLLLSLHLVATGSGDAAVLHVPGDHPTIQGAIEAASTGDSVLVQPATYAENLDFLGKAITVTGTDPMDPAVVDAAGVGAVVEFSTAEGLGSVLAGLTLTGGAGRDLSSGTGGGPSLAGGGIFALRSSPTIERCDLVANTVVSLPALGGGVYAPDGHIRLLDCNIRDNVAEIGAGVYVSGGEVLIEGCVIERNRGENIVGGIYLRGTDAEHIVRSCAIVDNAGGGVRIYSRCHPVFTNTVIAGNENGGVKIHDWSNPSFINCVVADNSAFLGGGITSDEYSDPTIVNTTVIRNSPYGLDLDRSRPTITNCIVWGNREGQIVGDYPTVDYSNVQGGWPYGTGNIDRNPRTVDRLGYRDLLRPDSPCVDTGDPDVLDGVSDWHPRWPDWFPNGPRSDMGAYGGPGNAEWVGAPPAG